VNIEDPTALHFIMQEELYLLNSDKGLYDHVNLPPALVEETPAVKINYMGGKKNKLLVLVHYPAHEFIDDVHLTALNNILKRKGLAINDVAILNMAKHETLGFDAIIEHFTPQKLLFLGKNALPASLPLTINLPQQVEGRIALYSFSFEEMMDNNEYKKAFWDQMKGL
jgi:hypothetical protein